MQKPIPQIYISIKKFIETIKNDTNDVTIEHQDTDLFEKYLSDEKTHKNLYQDIASGIEEIKTSQGITINEDQEIPFNLLSADIQWNKVDLKENNIPMEGGFAFNDGIEMILDTSGRWKSSFQDFLKYETLVPEDEALLKELIWVESPKQVSSSSTVPLIGCVRPNGVSFPYEFYFYDGGRIYPLPFSTYEEYILALISNAGLEGWQYFYIDPKELVQKNRGANYMTTIFRKGTRLVEDISLYTYDETYDIDRLDLIHEYLRRCARFLPETFPTLNFDHQEVYLEKLEVLL